MPCKWIRLPDGTVAHLNMGPERARKCSVCGVKVRDCKLCDFPIGGGKTCDAVLCSRCASHRPPDTDYCPAHAQSPGERLKL